MHLVGVHQKLCAVIIDCETEMVGNAFMHVQTRGPAERRSKVHTFLPMGQVRFEFGYGHSHSPLMTANTSRRGVASKKAT